MNREIKFRVWCSFSKYFEYGDLHDFPMGLYDGLQPQQFTGLTDKNGKEIYEGDIITNDYVGEFTYKIAKVIWNKNSWIADCGSGIWNMAFTQKMIEGTVRVIGNTFENPELLK